MAKISIPNYEEVEIDQSQFSFILSIAKELRTLYVVRDGYKYQDERPGATENITHKDVHYKIPYSVLLPQIQEQIDHYERVLIKAAKIRIKGGPSD